MLLRHYGKGQAIYCLYTSHRRFVSTALLTCLIGNGACFPRFLAQHIIQDFQSRTRSVPSTAVYVFTVKLAFELFGDHSDFKENDHRLFESLVRTNPVDAEMAIADLRTLISKYHFFPVLEQSHKLVGESLYLLSLLDLGLVTLLRNELGFDLGVWNDSIMDRVFQQPNITSGLVKSYLNIGFVLSDMVLKRAIAQGRPHVLDILDQVRSRQQLERLARDTVYDLFGPYLDRDQSLNILWSGPAVSRIVHFYSIPTETIETALLAHPSECCTFETVHTSFPVTRPYLKTKPYAIWQWVLEEYGPHHRFSIACFDDALSRAVGDEALHQVLDSFLQQGFVLRPRHIKILACRVLHRHMTGNALKVMVHLRKQIQERHRLSCIPDICSDADDVAQVRKDELDAFARALAREVAQNNDWKERSKTIQLGSGHAGGTFRIDRAPPDVVRFTEECTKLLGEIESWSRTKSSLFSIRDSKPKSLVEKSPRTFFKKFKR
ncbi:hypothetical protein HDV03_004744 [Kappamyces sp. JEL0829]|nr:hypothetical protein HDV03_004744 [Kappamyces sp. JEL0829]